MDFRILSRLILISMGLYGLEISSLAQSYSELAMFFSNTNTGGSARVMGLGGAQVSLGGDASLAYSNPAGLGMANKSSLSFSTAFVNNNSLSSYYGSSNRDGKFNFNIPQFTLSFYSPGSEDSNFKGGTFAVSLTRTNSFQSRTYTEGRSPDYSIIDQFIQQSDGMDPTFFDSDGQEYNTLLGLGWSSYLFDVFYDDQAGEWYSDSWVTDFPIEQRETENRRGGQYQWNFAYGANFMDRIFLGGGIGISSIRYSSNKIYSEFFDTSIPDYTVRDFSLEENLSVTGTGINMNLGATVRPIDIFQVGVSFVTPTLYNINDQYQAFVRADWDNYEYPSTGDILDNVSEETALLISDYRLTTPSRLNIGTTFFFGKHGFVTADIERVNYSNAFLRSSFFSMAPDNNEIKGRYSSTTNVRAGGELRLDAFRLRGGMGVMGDPVTGEMTGDRAITTISGGLGYYGKEMYVDMAISASSTGNTYYPIQVYQNGSNELLVNQPAKIENSIVNVMFTVGFAF